MLFVQIVVDALVEVVWLQHHDVALRAVELGGRAVPQLRGIRIVVAVAVVQRVVGHLAVQVVHHGVGAAHVYVALGSLLRHLRQHTVALVQVRQYVSRWLVTVAILVTRLVVEVRHVGIVRHAVVELHHGIGWLQNVHLREVRPHLGYLHLIHIRGELVGAHQSAGIHVAAVLIHAARVHELSEQRAVTLQVDARDAKVLHVRAERLELLPVDAGAGIYHQSRHIAVALQGELGVGELRQVSQLQGLHGTRQRHLCERRTLGEGHARERGLGGSELLQLGVLR